MNRETNDQSNEGSKTDLTTFAALTQLLDRLPLTYVMGMLGFCVWFSVTVWFSLSQIKDDLASLKATVAISANYASRMQLLEFRIQTNENDINVIRQALQNKENRR